MRAADSTAMTATRPSPGTAPRTALLASVAVGAAALVARAPGFVRQLFDPDEAALATMGMVITRGGVLYRDVIDRKPPLAPFAYAASFALTSSRDLRPLHLLAALELAGAALLVAWAVRRGAGSRAGWWAAGLFVAGAVAFGPADAQAANFSHLALLPATAAIVLGRRGSTRAALWAGVLLGIAVLTRQTWAIGVIPLAVAIHRHNERGARDAALGVGAAVATVLAAGLVVPFGPFLHWTFTGNGNAVLGAGTPFDVAKGALQFVAVFAVGHLAVLFLAWKRRIRREDADLWVWVVTGLVAAFAGARFFGHYWLQVLPPLVLLAAPAIDACTRRTRVVLAVLTVIPLLFFWTVAWHPEWLHRRANPEPLAAYVDAHTRPGDSIAIWGSFPEVFWRSGRSPSGALVISDFVSGRTAGRSADGASDAVVPGARAAFVDGLRRDPPRLFIDTSTHDIRGYDRYPLANQPEVVELLHRDYRPVAVVYGATIWERVTR